MKKYVLILTIVVFIILTFAGCKNSPGTETTTEKTTELTTVETSEEKTEKETEEDTTKAPETTKPKPQPTQPKPTQPKPTEPKPTQPKPTQPSGGGTVIEDNWSDEPIHPDGYVQDPDEEYTDADVIFKENGWDDSWQLH